MKTYDKYKPSGIEWIGEIPEHWDVKKLSYVFEKIGSGTTPKSDNEIYYKDGQNNWLLTGDLNDNFIYETSKKITDAASEAHSTLKTYPKDSVVMAMYGATIGKLGVLKIETTVNQACCVLSKPINHDYRITFYFLLAIRNEIINLSFGGGQPNISQEIVKSIKLPYSPYSEQTAIANYLDEKTAEIDQTIADKEELIKLYEEEKKALINEAVTKGIKPNVKLKPSGIDWLGDIPEHWEVKKLKLLTSKIGDGIHSTPIYCDGTQYYFVNGTNLKNGQIEINEGTRTVELDEYTKHFIELKPRSVLLSINGTVGSLSYFNNEKYVFGKSICYIEVIKDLHNDFLYYSLQSDFVFHYFEASLSGTTIKNLSLASIRNLKIMLPPIQEQTQIVEYIERERNLINEKINTTQQEIALLKEYRQALIFEAVTGKICVL